MLLHTEVEGEPVPDSHILGTAALTLIAGVDTTWSAIGSSLFHLATHGDDRRMLAERPEIMEFATEELLRLRLENDEVWTDLRGPTACELVAPGEIEAPPADGAAPNSTTPGGETGGQRRGGRGGRRGSGSWSH